MLFTCYTLCHKLLGYVWRRRRRVVETVEEALYVNPQEFNRQRKVIGMPSRRYSYGWDGFEENSRNNYLFRGKKNLDRLQQWLMVRRLCELKLYTYTQYTHTTATIQQLKWKSAIFWADRKISLNISRNVNDI